VRVENATYSNLWPRIGINILPNAVNVTKTTLSQQQQQQQQHFRPLDSQNAENQLPNLQNFPNHFVALYCRRRHKLEFRLG